MNNLMELIEKIPFTMTQEEKNRLSQRTQKITFQKNEVVLLAGNQAMNLYYLISGAVRGYFINEDGDEFTKCFSCEGDFFSAEGYRSKEVASYTIECIEEVNCLKIPYDLIDELSAENPKFVEFIQNCYLKELAELENRQKNLILMTATQRYELFNQHYGDFASRVPLKYIASYLGIHPASLSRIRQKI